MTPEGLAWGRSDAALGLYRLYAYRVHATARRLNAPHVNWQDFLSVGRFAAYRYALKAGAGFRPAVSNVVARRAMLRELHRAAGHPGSRWRAARARTVRLDDAPEGDPSLTRLDDEPVGVDGFSPALARAVASLTTRERQVLALRAGGDVTFKAVGRAVGVTPGRVRQVELRALQKLRDELAPPPAPPVAAPEPDPVLVALAARIDALSRRVAARIGGVPRPA